MEKCNGIQRSGQMFPQITFDHSEKRQSSSKDEKRERQRVFKNAANLKRSIREAFCSTKLRDTTQATRTFFRSEDVKIAHVLKARPNLDLETARQIALRVNPLRKDWPEIKWYRHAKPNGGWRPVCMFSIAHQATLKMIAEVLAAQWNRPTNLYGAASADPEDSSHGRDAAAHRVHDLLEQGFVHVSTADLKNAFGSVDLNALYAPGSKLTLQNAIIRGAIDTRNQRFKEVPPPEKKSNQNEHVRVRDPGEEHVWMEYTLGLWDQDGTSDSKVDPISDTDHSGFAWPQAEQTRSNTDRSAGDHSVHSRCIQRDDPYRHAAEELLNHALTGREGVDTRSQDTAEGPYHSSVPGPGSLTIPIDDMTIHSEPRPYSLAQGSATSPIIFAMLLGELPNATDDARFLVCHDDIIVLARTPEARSSMINTLRDYFANHCPAGSLTMETKLISDNGPFEWLGYNFDPAQVSAEAGGIGVGDRSYKRLVRRLNQAEEQDIADLEKYGYNMASGRPSGYPLRVWHTLRQWRSGCGAVHPQHEDLMQLIDFTGSGWVASCYSRKFRNPEVLGLHEAIFATTKCLGISSSARKARLRSVLKDFPLQRSQRA